MDMDASRYIWYCATDILNDRQRGREREREGVCLIRTLPQSKEFQPVSVSYGVSSVCVCVRISQKRVCLYFPLSLCVCVGVRVCVSQRKMLR